MKAYSYNAAGQYIGEVACQIDPVRSEKTGQEVYLLPANATYTEPPEYDYETHIPVWNGELWDLTEIEEEKEIQETEPTEPADSVYDELAAAYRQGVQEA